MIDPRPALSWKSAAAAFCSFVLCSVAFTSTAPALAIYDAVIDVLVDSPGPSQGSISVADGSAAAPAPIQSGNASASQIVLFGPPGLHPPGQLQANASGRSNTAISSEPIPLDSFAQSFGSGVKVSTLSNKTPNIITFPLVVNFSSIVS